MNIEFNIADFDRTDEENVTKKINSLIENSDLILADLEKIILTDSYFEDVAKAWKSYGREGKASNNEHAVGVATVVGIKSREPYSKLTVVINDEICKGLLSDNEDTSANALHTIHHELGHVHDDTVKYSKIYSEDEKCGKGVHHLTHELRIKSDVLWSEYIAERLSSSTVTKTFINHRISAFYHNLNLIADFYTNKKGEIYQRNEDVFEVFEEFKPYMSYSLKPLVQLAGIIHGLGRNHELSKYIENNIIKNIGDTDVAFTWKNLKIELSVLFNKYPNWEDVHQLDSLGFVILTAWNYFGFYPKKNKDLTDLKIKF